MNKCAIESCTKEAVKHGLCETHLRNEWYKAGYLRGVYKIYFKNSDKFYIGMAFDEGINQRFSKHKNFLIKEYSKYPEQNKSFSLLKYFNELCTENQQLSREEVFEKYVDYEVINGMKPFIPINSDENSFEFSDDKDRLRESYKFFESKNPEIINAINEMRGFMSRRKKEAIRQAKKMDKDNNTENCLNDNI